MTEIMESAKKLKRYLIKHGITQKAISQYLGMSQGNVSRFLNGALPMKSNKWALIEELTKGEITAAELFEDHVTRVYILEQKRDLRREKKKKTLKESS